MAAVTGLAAELALVALNFKAQGDIARHPWLQLSQKPGADIAELLFRYSRHGYLPAIACAILIQAVIFAALFLTAIYIYRLWMVRRVLTSPWMIVVFLAVGWGPIFIAEFVRDVRPDLNATYSPQGFAMSWIMITFWSSLLAAALTVGHIVRLIVVAIRRSPQYPAGPTRS